MTPDGQRPGGVVPSQAPCDHAEIHGHLVSIYNILTVVIITLICVICVMVGLVAGG